MSGLFRNGNMFKRFIFNLKEKKLFMFDLDKTLWDCTVEEDLHIRNNKIFYHTPKERHYMLTHIQEAGHEINISSRSSEPEVCKEFLRRLFPNIIFNSMQIFPTPENKQEHIKNILNGREINDFLIFDDELPILQDIKKTYPECSIFHTPNGFCYETFEETNNISKY